MNIFSFKNTTIESLDLSSHATSKIINDNAQINVININNSLCILSGTFRSQINITSNSLLDLDANFILNDSNINLINTTVEEKTITIVGTLNTLTSNLKINSDNNITLKLSVFKKNSSESSIDIFVNPIQNKDDFFKFHFVENHHLKKLPVNLEITDTKNILIDSNLNIFNVNFSTDMNLVITEKSDILDFKNINDTTFKSVTAPERVIKTIESLYPIAVPITSLLFKVNFKNGVGTVFIPPNRIISDIPNMNIILSSKRVLK
ncbi:MAG: hypothetical protein ACRCTZ_07220 [Sarcina sp.]